MRKILILLVVIGLVGVFSPAIGFAGEKEKVEVEAWLLAWVAVGSGNIPLEYTLNECKLFPDGLKKTTDPDVMIMGSLDGINQRHTRLRGNFQVVMRELGIVQGRGVEAQMQANYGIIAYNIMLYVGDSAEKATLMKVAAFEIEGSKRKSVVFEGGESEFGYTADEAEIALMAFMIGHPDGKNFLPYKGGYGDNLGFAAVVTDIIFSRKKETTINRFFQADYFPDAKKELIRALAIGDFSTVDRLLAREKIHKARGLWKKKCDALALYDEILRQRRR